MELGRRRVFRSMVAWFIIAGCVLVQVASEALPAPDLDEHIIRYVWLPVPGGFPIALISSWRYDVTTQGIRRTAVGVEAAPHELRLGRKDYLLLGLACRTVPRCRSLRKDY